MAPLLTYFEIWPERILGAVFGDPSRLYAYDSGDPFISSEEKLGFRQSKLDSAHPNFPSSLA